MHPTDDHHIASWGFFRQLRWSTIFPQTHGVACRSPFRLTTPTGGLISGRRFRPRVRIVGRARITGRAQAPESLRICGFFAPLGRTEIPRAVLIGRRRAKGSAAARVGCRWDRGTGWALHGHEGPSLLPARRTGPRSAAALRTPSWPTTLPSGPHPETREALRQNQEIPIFDQFYHQ